MQLTSLFRLSTCTVISQAVTRGTMTNSSLLSIPAFPLLEVFAVPSELYCTASWVEIRGESGEPTHFHTSHLVALIVNGGGVLRTQGEIYPIQPGDVVVIPRGVDHFFDPNIAGIDYVGLEVSDVRIDYQKHFHI